MSPSIERDEVVQFAEPRRGTYQKLIIRDDQLIGGILLGDVSKAAALLHAFDSNAALPEERINLLFDIGGGPPKRVTIDQIPLDAQICNCQSVNKGALIDCVNSGLRTFEAVREATRAGSACGSCESMVREVVAWACGGQAADGAEESPLPGSEGEHELQAKFGKSLQALAFYKHQVLDHLNSAMRSFIARQEMMFVGTADAKGTPTPRSAPATPTLSKCSMIAPSPIPSFTATA